MTAQAPQMNGEPGEVRLTLTVTRAQTGVSEQFDVIGVLTPCEDLPNGCNPHDSGA